jgi:hypothetical protein
VRRAIGSKAKKKGENCFFFWSSLEIEEKKLVKKALSGEFVPLDVFGFHWK